MKGESSTVRSEYGRANESLIRYKSVVPVFVRVPTNSTVPPAAVLRVVGVKVRIASARATLTDAIAIISANMPVRVLCCIDSSDSLKTVDKDMGTATGLCPTLVR